MPVDRSSNVANPFLFFTFSPALLVSIPSPKCQSKMTNPLFFQYAIEYSQTPLTQNNDCTTRATESSFRSILIQHAKKLQILQLFLESAIFAAFLVLKLSQLNVQFCFSTRKSCKYCRFKKCLQVFNNFTFLLRI